MLKRSMLAGLAAGTVLLHPGVPAIALEDCSGSDCAQIVVGSGDVPRSSGTGAIDIDFTPASSDGQVMQGADDVAAIAFSVGMPGDDSTNSLRLLCDGGRLAANAVRPGDALGDDFALVVENETCNERDRCLCPTEDGQNRDNFVNLVIYGPKNLPEGGPVEIPRLPAGTLATLNLAAGNSTNIDDEIDLNIYCEQNDAVTRPQFTANLSIGDQSAIDQTADRAADESRVSCTNGRVRIVDMTTPTPSCVGDCNGDRMVNIGELIRGVNIALGRLDLSECPPFDSNGDGQVGIGELIQAVNAALNGCP